MLMIEQKIETDYPYTLVSWPLGAAFSITIPLLHSQSSKLITEASLSALLWAVLLWVRHMSCIHSVLTKTGTRT